MKLVNSVISVALLFGLSACGGGGGGSDDSTAIEETAQNVEGKYSFITEAISMECTDGSTDTLNAISMNMNVSKTDNMLHLYNQDIETSPLISNIDLTKNVGLIEENGDFITSNNGTGYSEQFGGNLALTYNMDGTFKDDAWSGDYYYTVLFSDQGFKCDYSTTFYGSKISDTIVEYIEKEPSTEVRTYNLRSANLDEFSVSLNDGFITDGTSTFGDNYEMNLTTTLLDNELIDGVTVLPLKTTGQLSLVDESEKIDIDFTDYYNANGIIVHSLNNITGHTCSNTNTTDVLPSNAKIGDSGLMNVLQCVSNGTTERYVWLLEEQDGEVIFNTTIFTYSSSNEYMHAQAYKKTLNADKTIKLSFSIFNYYEDKNLHFFPSDVVSK